MRLQPSVQPFDGCPAPVDRSPFGGLLQPRSGPLVRRIRVDYWVSPILPLDDPSQVVTGIASVADDVLRVESPIGIARLGQQRRCLIHVMEVASGDVHDQGQFVGRVGQDVNLIAPYELLVAIGVRLHDPPRVRVRGVAVLALLAAVRPAFDVCAVDGDRLPEVRKCLEHRPRQRAHDVLDQENESGPCKSATEAGERRLAGDSVGRGNATRGGNVGVVVQRPNQVRNGWQTQDVVGDIATPQNAGVVARASATPWAFEFRQEFLVRQGIEDCLKFSDDRWFDILVRADVLQ